MQRRDFLISAGVVAGAAAAGKGVSAAWAQSPSQQQARLDRIGIMSYSFSSVLKHPGQPDDPARTLDVMDLPQMYVDRYGIHNIEMQHSHFLSTEPEYLNAFRERVERAKSRVIQINVEFGTGMNLSVTNENLSKRLETIDLTKKWVDHAVTLGCPRVMVNQGALTPEVRPGAAEMLKTMAKYGDARGVWVTVENRGASGWEAVEEVVRLAGTYTTPDMGNFADQDNQIRGMRALFAFHRGSAHVKLRPERYDLPTALRLARELGYTGLFSIEATSNVDPDPYIAVQKIKDVLMANI